MHHLKLTKLDGRPLHLYSRLPLNASLEAPTPFVPSTPANPHLRWHPFRGEWVAFASHRQERTFLPPAEYNPLAVTTSKEHPTELPAGNYDVAVFENLFPSLSLKAHGVVNSIVDTRPGRGVCEVVVFTQDPNSSLGALSLSHLELLIQVWAHRHQELSAHPEIKYVMPFENRGVEMGVTLRHPHGQIYAYPLVPPIAAKELEEQRRYYERVGRGLMADHLEREIEDGRRLLFTDPLCHAFVPAFARYPYEVWVCPTRAVGSVKDLNPMERLAFARALKTVLLKYDGLWNRPMPYLMVFHQAPVDDLPHPEAHFHVEFYPPYRMPGRLKYLAGTELGAGLYANDSLPEEKAAELKRIEVLLE